jgi:diguanylate cyclase (GGDEF)-like protein
MSSADGASTGGPRPDLGHVLVQVQAAGYRWTVGSDALDWNPHLPMALVADGPIATGAEWARRIDPDAMATRHSTVMSSTARDDGRGVPYELEYPLRTGSTEGGGLIWVEDTGRWHADASGRPAYAEGIVRIVTERHEAEQRLAIQTRIDPLTGSLNRPKLLDLLEMMINDARRFQSSCALLLVAIENIGALDASYGSAPDELVAAVAKRLRASMRAGDALGRFSNSIFGLALANCTLPDLHVAARRFIDAVHGTPVPTSAGPIGVRVTCAGIVAPRHADNQPELVTRVSDTLAELRRRKRGSFTVYAPNPERDEQRRQNIHLAEELVSALEEERVSLVFQPVVDARSGGVAWHEALARIALPDGERVSIMRYVEAAEKLGLVHLLDRRVLELAVAALNAHPAASLAVNISAETIVDEDWRQHLLGLLRRNSAIAPRLLIEITETAAPGDLQEAAEFVARLHEAGIRIALDDFGAGQTSFRSLRALGVDLVKIDGDFVSGMSSRIEDRAFVRAIISLATDIGFRTVAERVEDDATADMLREMGVDYLQGDRCGAPGDLDG